VSFCNAGKAFALSQHIEQERYVSMIDLKRKKLLVSGGIALACDIVEKAREMGIYTLVADWNVDSPAKRIADEAVLISTRDIDGIARFAEENKIDGIITQYIDSNLPYVQKICAKLGLPFFATEHQLELISNKKKAKHLCVENGIPVPKEYDVIPGLSSNITDHIDNIRFPVLIKPVDNSGHRGISICRNNTELKIGYEKALSFSECNDVVIEQYLTGDYVVLCFTVQDGYLSLSAMADKPVIDEIESNGLLRLPKGYILPSKYIDQYYSELHNKFINLAKSIGLKNGSFSVEAIISDGIFHVFEMQYRLGGMKHHDFVLQENGIDIVKMHIHYALTGKFFGWNLRSQDNPYFKKCYCLLNLLLKPGKIRSIYGLDEVQRIPGVIKFLPMHDVGDIIELTGTVMQIFAKVSIIADSKEKLCRIIDNIINLLAIHNEYGASQLMETVTEKDLLDTHLQ
jgi:biotin carboxylase